VCSVHDSESEYALTSREGETPPSRSIEADLSQDAIGAVVKPPILRVETQGVGYLNDSKESLHTQRSSGRFGSDAPNLCNSFINKVECPLDWVDVNGSRCKNVGHVDHKIFVEVLCAPIGTRDLELKVAGPIHLRR